MSFARWLENHRRSILFMLVLLAAGGAFSFFKLPVALFPQVQFPRIQVSLDAGDRPADQMVLQVTRPVERAVRGVRGVRSVRSTTSRGSTDISINFDWGRNMAEALLQVQSAVNRTMPNLPSGTTFTARRMDPTVFPVIAYSLTSKTKSQVQLRDLAEYQLVPLLSQVDGVAKVGVQGGKKAEYRVSVDPARLNALGLSIDDVANALSSGNVLTAVGKLEDHYKLYLAVTDTRLKNLSEIRRTIVRSGKDGQVELEDVAHVTRATAPNWQRITADGRDAVLLNVYQQPGASVVKLEKDLATALTSSAGHLPAGVKMAQWYDQSRLVTASAASVRDAIGIGVVLAGLVLLVFLRNLRITLVAVIAVPAVLAATMVLLYALGMSLNIMTLGGMAAAVGLIIDDIIVMVEQIVRRVQETGEHGARRVLLAAREFTRPLAGSSSSTVIIFLPLAFLSGVTGAFFKALSLTMAAALVISFLVTWLAVPLLSDFLITERHARTEHSGPIQRRLLRGYTRAMVSLLRRPWWLLAGLIPLLAAGWFAYHRVGTGFMPAMDEGGFILDYRAPPGTSLTETDRLLRQVGKIISAVPDVRTYSRRTGAQLGGGLTEANTGDFFVRLKPPPRRGTETVMEEVRQKVHARVPGLDIELAQLVEDEIGDLTAVPQPIEIKLFGDDPNQLRQLAPNVAHTIEGIPGVVDVQNGVVLAGDSLRIDVNRVKAAAEGVTPEQVTKQLHAYLHGVTPTQVQEGNKFVGVRATLPKRMRATTDRIGQLLLRAPDGHVFPLERVATVKPVTGQPEITRDDLKTMVAVTGRISGRSLGKTIADVKAALNGQGLLPQGVYYELGGLYKQQQIAFHGLIQVFGAAVALVFTLLLFLYERFRVALAIMACPLLAALAVFIGLWITGVELNITAMMGMTMVIGIVTEVAIFYFSELTVLQPGRPDAATLIRAGRNRMRPIAMTTLAFILALLPLAFALGRGSAMQQPLAIAIISGLVVQMPLVLLMMPVVYSLLIRRDK